MSTSHDLVKLHAINSQHWHKKRIKEITNKLKTKSLSSKEKTKLQQITEHDLHTEYLLEAIPLINRWHTACIEVKNNPKNKGMHLVNKNNICMSYLRLFNPELLKKQSSMQKQEDCFKINSLLSKCCGVGIEQQLDSSLVCPLCGLVTANTAVNIADPSKNISYNRSLSTSKLFHYRRVNHLREFLRQITGRVNITVSEEDIDKIKKEIKKVGIILNRVDEKIVRKIMKRNKLNKCYEQCVSITRKLNPTYKAIRLTVEYEEKLVMQFIQLERPFEIIRNKVDKKRRNFLSYPFVFYRLNELNGRSDLNRTVRLLKSTKLIAKQDNFWRLIVHHLGWTFKGRSIFQDFKQGARSPFK